MYDKYNIAIIRKLYRVIISWKHKLITIKYKNTILEIYK